jgi:hypothetical protein
MSSTYGPYDSAADAEAFAARLRAVNPPEPWMVVRVVETETTEEPGYRFWPDVIDARRLGWGMPTLAEERAQNAAALAAHPMPSVSETAQLIAALERRGLAVTVEERRTRMANGQICSLRAGSHTVSYFE